MTETGRSSVSLVSRSMYKQRFRFHRCKIILGDLACACQSQVSFSVWVCFCEFLSSVARHRSPHPLHTPARADKHTSAICHLLHTWVTIGSGLVSVALIDTQSRVNFALLDLPGCGFFKKKQKKKQARTPEMAYKICPAERMRYVMKDGLVLVVVTFLSLHSDLPEVNLDLWMHRLRRNEWAVYYFISHTFFVSFIIPVTHRHAPGVLW